MLNDADLAEAILDLVLERGAAWNGPSIQDWRGQTFRKSGAKLSGTPKGFWRFYREVLCIGRKWLNRRSQRARMRWDLFWELLKRYPLPLPIAIHSAFRQAAISVT